MKLPFRTHAYIRWIWAMSLVVFTTRPATAQCPAGSIINGGGTITNGNTTCITSGFSGSVQLNNGAKMVVINGGNYTGDLNTNQGSTIQIQAGGRLAPGNANNFASNVTNNGTVVMNNVSLQNGAAITNSGSFTWGSNWNQGNVTLTVSNTACGTMNYSQGTALDNNSTINNNGVLNFAQGFNLSSGSKVDNRGRFTVGGDLTINGLFKNQNIAVFKGNNNNLSSSNNGDSLVNLGKMTFSNSISSNIPIRNEGLLWVNGQFTLNGGKLLINNSNAQVRIGSSGLSNNGQIQGNGSLYIAGSISNNNQTIRGYGPGAQQLTVNKASVPAPGGGVDLIYNTSLAAADTGVYLPGMWNPDACIALPVQLSSLQAAYYNGQVQLNWVAYAASDARSFTIEYSQDGRLFTRAGELMATGGNNQTIPYVYMHAPAVTGTVFYRVRVTALDGNMYYSNMVVVKAGNTLLANTTVFPNPFTEILQISMQLEKAGMIQVALYNAGGQLVRKQQHTGVLGQNTIVINDLSALPTGSYLVQVKAGDHTSFGKIIK